MSKRLRSWLAAGTVGAVVVSGALVSTASGASARPDGGGERHKDHVLLISVDGLHASDLSQCITAHMCPHLAALSAGGTTYAHASASNPSDSSPGLVALVTGGSPKLTGVYYDDSYDRAMFAPPAQTTTGTQDCSGPAGAEAMYFENVDTNAPSTANHMVGTRTILNESIDPAQLGRLLQSGHCLPVTPNDFLRTNSIFSVAHQAGLRTAWADKHPSADQMVSGHATPNAVDDKFMSEINADIIPPTLVDTRGRTLSFPLTNMTNNGFAITDSVGDTESYDQTKVDAILNQIDGLTSDGVHHAPTPAIFGMNFQAVSVGQKLVDPILSCVRSNNGPGCDPTYFPGGYEPGTLAFTPQLRGAIGFVDGALGSMVSQLKAEHLLSSTEIVISAKHGQSPIDPSKLAKIGHAENTVLTNAGVGIAQSTDDDIALIWLQHQSQTEAGVAALQADKAGANTAHVATVLASDPLVDRFGDPKSDPRTPDVVVEPIPGTIYTTSGSKVAEHGGFALDDTHVAMLVVDGASLGHDDGHGAVVDEPVQTTQVAPTILKALGLDAALLDAVRIEHTRSLPGTERD
jgi:hypothetical protein